MSGLVVDTSVWIDSFAGRSVPALEQALAQGSVVLAPIVAAELISGARSRKDRAALVELLAELNVPEAPLDHWFRVGDLRRPLTAKGVAVSTPDAHVAQCALDLDAVLLSRDAVFKRIAGATAPRHFAGSLPRADRIPRTLVAPRGRRSRVSLVTGAGKWLMVQGLQRRSRSRTGTPLAHYTERQED